jgi:predicted GNAT superfamily acetyltransferase
MRACVALQKEIWNFADIDLVPLRVFVVAQKIGGQVIGAYDGGELISLATPICIPRCWLCVPNIATPAWAAV